MDSLIHRERERERERERREREINKQKVFKFFLGAKIRLHHYFLPLDEM